MVNRRTFSTMLMAGAATSFFGWSSKAQAQPAVGARNVVLVHGANAGLVEAGGFAQLSEQAFLRDFAGGVDIDKARVLYAVQGRIADTLFASRTTAAAWKLKPSWYAVSKQDRTTSPELERFLANRMHAKMIEVDASHLSLITHPQEITDLILNAAGRSG